MEVAHVIFQGVTIGPDGTVIGRRVTSTGRQPFVSSLAMLWIDLAWEDGHPRLIEQLCLLQDGLGKPGLIPPEMDYQPAIRASSFEAVTKMLAVARAYLSDERIAELLGVQVGDLIEVLDSAYGL